MTTAASTQTQPRPVPSPKPVPLLGNFPEMLNGGALEAFSRNFQTHGDIFRLNLGKKRNLHVISSPELTQEVLIDRNTEFPKADAILRLLLGNGLVTISDHKQWMVNRRMMQPMFHRARLAAMGDKMTAAIGRLTARLEGQTSADLSFEMMEVTLDIITQIMFSADVLSQAGTIGPAVSNATQFLQKRLQTPFPMPMHYPLPSHTRFHTAKHTLETVVQSLIDERRALIARGETPPGDLLDMLLEARDADTGEGMSDSQLRDEVLTIFSAGHETTAHTLSFALAAISQHPEMQTRLQREADEVLAGRAPSMADLERLTYTTQVMNETLRLFPAAPITSPRLATTDTRIGGFDVPKGAFVIPSIFNIHRHPRFWNAPERFDPDRWANGFEPAHRLAFMPFGAGPRKCIGNNLSMMEGQLILAGLMQRFTFALEPDQRVQLEQAVTLRPKGGLRMRLTPRQK
jgi:cytochrome P450